MNMSAIEIAAKGPIAVVGGSQTDQGKTTVAKFLSQYAEVLGVDARHIMIDKPENPPDGEDIRFSATDADFKQLMVALASICPGQLPVLDLGGHAFEKFMRADKAFGGEVRTEIKLFIVPVMANTKEALVLSTVQSFIQLGAPPEHIVIVFNRVTGEEEAAAIASSFPLLHEASQKLGFRICSEPVYLHSIVAECRGTNANLFALAALDRAEIIEQRKAAHAANNEPEFERLVQLQTRRGMAQEPVANFTHVFNKILGVR